MSRTAPLPVSSASLVAPRAPLSTEKAPVRRASDAQGERRGLPKSGERPSELGEPPPEEEFPLKPALAKSLVSRRSCAYHEIMSAAPVQGNAPRAVEFRVAAAGV